MIIVFFFEHRVSYDHSRHKLAERHDGLTLYVLCDLVFLRFPPRSRNWRKEEVEKYVTKKCVQVDFIAAFGATRLSVRTATAILTYFPASLLLFSAGETTSTCSPSGVVCRMSCRPGRSCVVRTRSGVMVFGHAFEVVSSFSFCASLTNTVSSSFGESMIRSVSSSSASKTTLPCVSLSGCGLNGSTSDKLTPHEYVRSTCEGNAKPAEPSFFFFFFVPGRLQRVERELLFTVQALRALAHARHQGVAWSGSSIHARRRRVNRGGADILRLRRDPLLWQGCYDVRGFLRVCWRKAGRVRLQRGRQGRRLFHLGGVRGRARALTRVRARRGGGRYTSAHDEEQVRWAVEGEKPGQPQQ